MSSADRRRAKLHVAGQKWLSHPYHAEWLRRLQAGNSTVGRPRSSRGPASSPGGPYTPREDVDTLVSRAEFGSAASSAGNGAPTGAKRRDPWTSTETPPEVRPRAIVPLGPARRRPACQLGYPLPPSAAFWQTGAPCGKRRRGGEQCASGTEIAGGRAGGDGRSQRLAAPRSKSPFSIVTRVGRRS